MPNSAEVIERLARQLERELILSVARESESLEELIKFLETLVKASE